MGGLQQSEAGLRPRRAAFIDYEGHPNDYAGTDRAPVEHEAVRYQLERAKKSLPVPDEPKHLQTEARALLEVSPEEGSSVVDERSWDHCAAGEAGRLLRRLPARKATILSEVEP